VKIYLAGRPRDLNNAKDWFSNGSLREALDDLEETIGVLERSYGPCTVFIECTFPSAGKIRSRQIDLLLSFRDRAALCEIKQGLAGKTLRHQITGEIEQIRGQAELIEAHLKMAGLGGGSVSRFLWAPHLGQPGLEEIVVQTRIAGADYDITPAGGNANLRGIILPALPEGIPAYLPEAIEHRLQRHSGFRSLPNPGVASTLTDIVCNTSPQSGIPLLEFENFTSIRERLRGQTRHVNVEIELEATDVRDLRSSEIYKAQRALREFHLVEITGPVGVGKSTFIMEMLGHFLQAASNYRLVVSCVIQNCRSERDVLHALASEVIGPTRANRLDEDALLDAMERSESVLWIRDYDQRSYPAIRLLMDKLRHSNREERSYWIIESMIPSQLTGKTIAAYQVALMPLDNGAIASILRRLPESRGRDVNDIVISAGGIPLRATMLLRTSGKIAEASRLDRYELFLITLKPDQRHIVDGLAYFLSESPLGTTIQLIEEWARTVLLSAADVREVLEKAQAYRLITVETFGSARLGAEGTAKTLTAAWQEGPVSEDLLEIALPQSIHESLIGWIRIYDPHFIEYFVNRIDQKDLDKWQQYLQNALLERVQSNKGLTGVTLALLIGDIEPFIRSSFRSSSAVLPAMKSWAADRVKITDRNMLYFDRWLSWMLDHYWDTTAEVAERGGVAWSLEAPNRAEPLQILMFSTVRTRGLTYWKGKDYDWNAWTEAAAEFLQKGEIDLWAETLIRQAQTLVRGPYNSPERAWELFAAVLREINSLSPDSGRSTLCFHVLSFFNKRKILASRLPTLLDEGRTLVPTLVEHMIRDGLATENVNSIANALFFLFRPVEIRSRATGSREVENCLGIMRFVERISPARRIHALLTQGSIHRHYCSQDKITWEEFRDHADGALEIYERALSSARPARMTTFAANALSYSGFLLLKATRFADAESMGGWLRTHSLRVLRAIEQFLKSAPETGDEDDELGSLDAMLICNLYKYRALLSWIVAQPTRPEVLSQLPIRFNEAINNLEKVTRTFQWLERLKTYQQLIGEVNRTLGVVARQVDVLAAKIETCAPPIFHLLEDAGRMLPKNPANLSKSDMRKQGDRLVRAMMNTGIAVPEKIRNTYAAPPRASSLSVPA